MKLNEYISLNLFASLAYISFVLIIYLLLLEAYIIKHFSKAYITIEICGEIYIYIFSIFVPYINGLICN